MRTLLWNSEGLKNATSLLPQNIFHIYDLVFLTETFLLDEWHQQGFYCINNMAKQGDRGRPRGGTSILMKPKLSPFKITHKSDFVLMVKANLCTAICVYFPPDMKQEDIIAEIGAALTKVPNSEPLILAGDLNTRIDSQSNKTSAVLDYLQEEGLSVVNKASDKTYYCYNGSSTIDLLFVNDRLSATSQNILYNIVIRKHLPVETTLLLKKNGNTKQTHETKLARKLDTEKLGRAQLSNTLQSIQTGSIDSTQEGLERIIIEAIPTLETNKRISKPWFNTLCYAERRLALKALHMTKEFPTDSNLRNYSELRKQYKKTLKAAKEAYEIKQEMAMIEAAERDPFKALKPRNPKFPKNIPMEVWIDHLSTTICGKETRPPATYSSSENFQPITKQEIMEVIRTSKDQKAPGPDQICNEHLKAAAPTMIEAWTALLNECLRQGRIPTKWRTSKIKMLYKGKGDAGNPNSYRGIALENTLLKVLTKILTQRLTQLVDAMLPEFQFGFRTGRSTIQAVQCLKQDITEALSHDKGKLYTVFVDYTKAFDLLDRRLIIHKLEEIIGREHYITKITRDILHNNNITIDDGISISKHIQQTIGVLQGDPLSPLLFNIATADISEIITKEAVKIYVYADDLAISSTSREELQETLDRLAVWARERDLKINLEKTVYLIFRKGGRTAADDTLKMDGIQLQKVNKFKYLGITFQTQGTVFNTHIRDRVTHATRAMQDIHNINKLSLNTAIKLFKTKINPIITYGLEIIWEDLNRSNLNQIEKVKATYLKRILCISKFSPSRLAYELARETFYIEDLRHQLLLPATEQYVTLRSELRSKKNQIWDDFYTTHAMTSHDWKRASYDLRHVTTRLAIHGFHFKLCKTKSYHDPNPMCICDLCECFCDRYHVLTCKQRKESLTQFCSE